MLPVALPGRRGGLLPRGGVPRLSLRALNRALLARQGLLERLDAPLVEAVEAIGPLQAQAWAAPPAALCSRVEGFAPRQLHAALERGELVIGTLLRGTIHIVSAREHPAFAAVASEVEDWRRTDAERTRESDRLAADLRKYAKQPRTGEEIAAFAEEWVSAHPQALATAEIERQRELKWRPLLRSCALVRVPQDGRWGAKAPAALRAAPPPKANDALPQVIRRHLCAFGPAAADDVASFIKWRTPVVREAMDALDLERFDGLYDLPDAPRPDPDTPAPSRLLAAFDSALLAYASQRRQRIVPDEHRDAVYERRNLQVRPTFLIDGTVAGTWSLELKRRTATLTLKPLEKIRRGDRAALLAEAERVARCLHPGAKGHEVTISG
jgi:Winged helix DNA-binding domain